MLAQFVTKKMEHGLYTQDINISCGCSANGNSSLNDLIVHTWSSHVNDQLGQTAYSLSIHRLQKGPVGQQ